MVPYHVSTPGMFHWTWDRHLTRKRANSDSYQEKFCNFWNTGSWIHEELLPTENNLQKYKKCLNKTWSFAPDHLITWSFHQLISWSFDQLHSLIHSLWTHWTTFVFMSMLKNLFHIVSLSLSHHHSFSLPHSFNLSFNHSQHAEQLLSSSLCSKVIVYFRKWQRFFRHCPHHPILW